MVSNEEKVCAARDEGIAIENRLLGYLASQLRDGYYILKDVKSGGYFCRQAIWDFGITGNNPSHPLIVIECKNNDSALNSSHVKKRFALHNSRPCLPPAYLAIPDTPEGTFAFYKFDSETNEFELVGKDIDLQTLSADVIEESKDVNREKLALIVIPRIFAVLFVVVFVLHVLGIIDVDTNSLVLLVLSGLFAILPFMASLTISPNSIALKLNQIKAEEKEEE